MVQMIRGDACSKRGRKRGRELKDFRVHKPEGFNLGMMILILVTFLCILLAGLPDQQDTSPIPLFHRSVSIPANADFWTPVLRVDFGWRERGGTELSVGVTRSSRESEGRSGSMQSRRQCIRGKRSWERELGTEEGCRATEGSSLFASFQRIASLHLRGGFDGRNYAGATSSDSQRSFCEQPLFP